MDYNKPTMKWGEVIWYLTKTSFYFPDHHFQTKLVVYISFSQPSAPSTFKHTCSRIRLLSSEWTFAIKSRDAYSL